MGGRGPHSSTNIPPHCPGNQFVKPPFAFCPRPRDAIGGRGLEEEKVRGRRDRLVQSRPRCEERRGEIGLGVFRAAATSDPT
ncbi:hypothetical protein EYF80_058746 [Liparis tanakae]|uniref:Uncharacterized protein n=1 Tax=Liparis tanakae TaxID=230148 RepID=A0A4Z2ES46_9TELE|nr:hypothetical protein EYF80_058746 [Liparis tanakae]